MYKFFSSLAFIACTLIATGLSSAYAGDSMENPAAQYKVLEWSALVPTDWEAPLIPPAHDEVAAGAVEPGAVVGELNQQLIALPGFMKPIVFEENTVSEFLLVPFLPHHTKSHAHLEANQMIYVSLLEPVSIEKPFDPVWIVGTLSTSAVMTDEGPAGYSISDAVLTEYKY